MKTLQDMIDAKVAEIRAAEAAAMRWRNGQAGREAEVAELFARGLREMFDLTLGECAYAAAYEDAGVKVCATERAYSVAIILPDIDAALITEAVYDAADYSLALVGKQWNAHANGRARAFPNNGSRLAALVDALMWLTDDGKTALSGAPVLVTLPQTAEQEI